MVSTTTVTESVETTGLDILEKGFAQVMLTVRCVISMRERATAVGGTLTIDSNKRGTTVSLHIPICLATWPTGRLGSITTPRLSQSHPSKPSSKN